jgi:hypothetical protein
LSLSGGSGSRIGRSSCGSAGASGLLDYYLGTIATAGRTPTAAIAWDRLLSVDAWLRLFRDHSLCGDPRLMLCIEHRWAWLQIAALCGAVLAIIRRCGGMRTAAWALVAYIGLAHVYAYAYQVDWLGPVGVLSSHFMILSCWSFICMFAVVPFFDLARLIKENAYAGLGRFAHFGLFADNTCRRRDGLDNKILGL